MDDDTQDNNVHIRQCLVCFVQEFVPLSHAFVSMAAAIAHAEQACAQLKTLAQRHYTNHVYPLLRRKKGGCI